MERSTTGVIARSAPKAVWYKDSTEADPEYSLMGALGRIHISYASVLPMEEEPFRPSSSASATLSSAKLVANLKKQPPPESYDSIRIRSLVIASFWAVIIFLGLPIWYWTTSIHRARLPLREMLEWADGKVCLATSRALYNTFVNDHNSLGLQTCVSASDSCRRVIITGKRSGASCAHHTACP